MRPEDPGFAQAARNAAIANDDIVCTKREFLARVSLHFETAPDSQPTRGPSMDAIWRFVGIDARGPRALEPSEQSMMR